MALIAWGALVLAVANAAPVPARPAGAQTSATAATAGAKRIIDRLAELRQKVVEVETGLIESVKSNQQIQANVKKIQLLLKLQSEERMLGRARMAELEKTIGQLEGRRKGLVERIATQQASVRQLLKALRQASEARRVVPADPADLIRQERTETPRRRMVANLASHGLKEIEALRVDMHDADSLAAKISEEKQQLVYLIQDLNEKESVLELNRQLQVDLLRKKHHDRLAQLQSYHKLKKAEAQVEHLLGQFNARLELEQAIATERAVSKAMMQSAFARQKGTIPLPVTGGKVIGGFGRSLDPKSGLYVFKKGVEIAASGGKQTVKAVAPGRVAFSGALPDYGRVAILDHGDHFYTLCAHLGSVNLKKGDLVAQGAPVGETDDSGTPVYFEIRARNVAVNPLQWLAN